MRGLKDRLVEELNTGKLAWLLEVIKGNPALSLGFGANILEVYYRGALAVTVKPGGGYTFVLDEGHFTTDEMKEEYNIFMRDKKAIPVYQRKFPVLLQALDIVAESSGLVIEFPQEVAEANTCVLDPNYAIAVGVTVMLAVVNGNLMALKSVSSDVAAAETAFASVNQGELLESAGLIMANRVALGLMEAELPLGSAVEFAVLCTAANKPASGKTLCLPEGSFNLADCT